MDTPRVREEAGEALESIADQIEEGIARGKFSLRDIQSAMMEKGKAAAQSTDTPRRRGVIGNVWAPNVNTTGTLARRAERCSSSRRASAGVSPPTSMPAIRVPPASLSGEPA